MRLARVPGGGNPAYGAFPGMGCPNPVLEQWHETIALGVHLPSDSCLDQD